MATGIYNFTMSHIHYVKSVQIGSFSWSIFRPNAEKYVPEKTSHLDTFHAVIDMAERVSYKGTTPIIFSRKVCAELIFSDRRVNCLKPNLIKTE